MSNFKVRAFTLMEITVSMLISAIVIGITYSAYLIVSQSYISFHKKNDDTAELLRLNELLQKDFDRADSIEKTQDGILFRKGPDSVKYLFQPEYVVRKSSIVDTFKCQTQDVYTTCENNLINDVSSAIQQNRVDELNMTIVSADEKFPYHYYKKYSSADLIERMKNAVN